VKEIRFSSTEEVVPKLTDAAEGIPPTTEEVEEPKEEVVEHRKCFVPERFVPEHNLIL
jgi:hypothetical protein